MTSLAQIVAALSVTYNDQGVAIWLDARNRGLGLVAPLDVIARDPGGIERVADLVRAIGDADPALFTMREDSPDPRPRLNDCGFIGTYEEHHAMGCCKGPKLNGLAVLQRAARRAEGERDTAELLGHCDRCNRPLPHTDAETRACPVPDPEGQQR